VIIPLWRGPGPYLNSLHQRIICTKFDWFWPAGSGEEDSYKFSVYFYSFTIISPWKRAIPFLWKKINSHHPRIICAKSGSNLPNGFGGEDFQMTPYHFYIFVIISPLKRTWPFIWTNLDSIHPRIICIKIDWFWPVGSEKEDFYKVSVYFYSFAIISPLRRAISFDLWINLNPLHARMICAKSG
jgi:hypothetical protein